MCGIVGYIGKKEAAPILLAGLERLEYRGYDSAGIAVLQEEKLWIEKVSGRIAGLREKTQEGTLTPGTVGIGHTRWATHGAPTDTNAHPHTSNNGWFAVVHNGIIENYMELREELQERGVSFQSETDTEVIVHLLEFYYEGNLKDAVRKMAARLRGSYALGILCSREPSRIYVLREASPLLIGIGVGEHYFASDVTALVPYTRNIIDLEDGELAEVTAEEVRVFDAVGKTVTKCVQRIVWDIQAAEKGGYEHFMRKEILEQPGAVKATLEPRIQNGEIVLEDFSLSEEMLQGINKILITACGSAYYAGCAGKYALERLCKIPVFVELASELRYGNPLVDERTLLIVLSQSGETADSIAAMKECKALGARTMAIVNVVGSTIAKLAECVLYTWAGPEIAVATTKGYTTQVSLLYLFALYLAKVRNQINSQEYKDRLAELERLPGIMQQALDMNPELPLLAKKYHRAVSMFFLGRNTDYAVAQEAALKMKEISYIHAEAYAAGELKHGTIALIEEKQPVIALCGNEELLDKTMSNLIEVKARGAEVLAVTCSENQKILSIADDRLLIPKLPSLFGAVAEILPMQLFAYYVAREKDCDIDKPKNLAKSVTVE